MNLKVLQGFARLSMIALGSVTLLSDTGYAADKKAPKPKSQVATEIKQTTAPDGKKIQCGFINGKGVAGKPVKKTLNFISLPAEKKYISQLLKLNLVSGKAKTAKEKRLAAIKKTMKSYNATCAALTGGGTGPGDTTPPPVELVDCSNLAALGRNPSADEMRYLLEKIGYGVGTKEQAIVDMGVAQGLDAAVTEYMRIKPEGAGLLQRVEDWQDEQLGQAQAPSTKGARIGLLDYTVNTNNPFRLRLAHELLGLYTVGAEVLTAQSQIYLWWDYFKMLLAAADNPKLEDLLIKVGQHPLMLIYLDNSNNLRTNVNENYAREVMELFSVGPNRFGPNGDAIANYVEERNGIRTLGDINTAARRLTGWRAESVTVNNVTTWRAVRVPSQHSQGPEKMFAGTAYEFMADDDVDLVKGILANHPAASTYYAREFLKVFVTPHPPETLVNALGASIKANNYNLEVPLATLFKSKAFFCPTYKNTVPKTSFHVAVEFLRTLKLEPALATENYDQIDELEGYINQMGWSVTFPPNVFYFPQTKWKGPSTLSATANYFGVIVQNAIGLDTSVWSPASILPPNVPGVRVSGRDAALYVAKKLGVTLSEDQVSQLNQYLITRDGGTTAPYNNESLSDQRLKGIVLYLMLAMQPDFLLG